MPSHEPSATVIRPYVASDYDGVRALFAQLDGLHRERVPWMFRPPDREPRPPEHIEKLLSPGDAALLVAVEGNEVLGLITIALRALPDFPVFLKERRGVIDDLVVSPSQRRRGTATRLLRAAEAWVQRAGAPWLVLNVYDVNVEARAFYEAAGYAPYSTRLRKPI